MTRDVVIRRCVIHVVRHGGWNWSPAPRRLVDRLIRDLPQLLTHHLDGLDIPEGDAELTTPVRIAIRIPASDLQGPGPFNAHLRHGEVAARLVRTPPSPQPAAQPPFAPPFAEKSSPATSLARQPAGPQPPPAAIADPAIPLPRRPARSHPPQEKPILPSRCHPSRRPATGGASPRRPA